MWLLRDDFMQFCRRCWEEIPFHGGMLSLFNRLHHLKGKLSSWNNEHFGNLFDMMKEAEEDAARAEMLYEADPSPEHRTLCNLKQDELVVISKREHAFWRQKCNVKWLQDGDANTKFFHNLVKEKRRKQRITTLTNDQGHTIEHTASLEAMVVEHYKNLFNSHEPMPSQDVYESFLNAIPPLLFPEHNDLLMRLPEEEEIRNILWEMDSDSAAGPDGFNCRFFKACWDFVKRDVTSACQEVFLGIPLPPAAASSNICLLPKVENAQILKRLGTLLPLIILEEQGAYVPGREILDQILITKEMVHHINRKANGGNLIIKLDMAKAFDKLKWSYLFDILQQFGFCAQFINMVKNLLSSSKYSVLFNGKPCGYFGQSRGIKQRDPLSPLLFIISNEGFSRNLKKLFSLGRIGHFNCGTKSIPITHLSYSDDIIIFSSGHARSILNLRRFLEDYQLVSGQTINYQKSSFVVGKKANIILINKLQQALNMPFKAWSSN
ncbi:unnamed protein product [Cuscuta campestris]|uniref:Reverse transcriptase domain-containing protein n=1 Tax=Cuscuta campestris TaxID=132261 RepID=A0A484MEQ0_9ASTE|nr:unnamed protein product [Cuscuta campestris]